jgi:hypothetical protein
VIGTDADGFPAAIFHGPGRLQVTVQTPVAASYRLWLGGEIDRNLQVSADGHGVGSPSGQSGADGNMIDVATVALQPGRHLITLLRGGGGLGPGDDAGTMIDGVYLERVGVEHETVTTLAPSAWRSLCGRQLDWIEVT